jgi:hypothetical protein
MRPAFAFTNAPFAQSAPRQWLQFVPIAVARLSGDLEKEKQKISRRDHEKFVRLGLRLNSKHEVRIPKQLPNLKKGRKVRNGRSPLRQFVFVSDFEFPKLPISGREREQPHSKL